MSVPVDKGSQNLFWQYYDPLTSTEFDQRLKGIAPVGVYEGGLLSKVSDSVVRVTPWVIDISDGTYQVRGASTVNYDVGDVSSTNNYIVLRWTYNNVHDWFVDMLAVASGNLQSNDIILGKAVYAGSTLTGFNYSERSIPLIMDGFLEVIPTAPASMSVHIRGGWCTYGNSKLIVEEQDSPALVAPSTNPRIDLIYVDSSGNVQVEQGIEDASPVAPSHNGQIVLAQVTLQASSTSITADMIEDTRPFISIGGGAGGSTEIEVIKSSHGFVVGDVLRLDGSTYVKALADSVVNAEAVGIVVAVVDTNTFKLATPGHTTGLSSLTPGAVYFLSDSTPGLLTTTEPTAAGSISKPMLVAETASAGFVLNMRGTVIQATTGATVYTQSFIDADLVSGVLTVTHNLSKYVVVQVYDSSDDLVIVKPHLVDGNSLTIDLSSIAPISGTWNLVVVG